MRLRATEYVTSPPASPKQRLSRRVIHAKAPAAPLLGARALPEHRSPLVPPDPCLRVGGVSRHREHLAPGHPPPSSSSPLLSLSISPSRGLVGGSVMKFHIFIQGNNRKWSRPWNAVKQPSLKDISKPPGGRYCTCCCRTVCIRMRFSPLLFQSHSRNQRRFIKHGKKNTEINVQV